MNFHAQHCRPSNRNLVAALCASRCHARSRPALCLAKRVGRCGAACGAWHGACGGNTHSTTRQRRLSTKANRAQVQRAQNRRQVEQCASIYTCAWLCGRLAGAARGALHRQWRDLCVCIVQSAVPGVDAAGPPLHACCVCAHCPPKLGAARARARQGAPVRTPQQQ